MALSPAVESSWFSAQAPGGPGGPEPRCSSGDGRTLHPKTQVHRPQADPLSCWRRTSSPAGGCAGEAESLGMASVRALSTRQLALRFSSPFDLWALHSCPSKPFRILQTVVPGGRVLCPHPVPGVGGVTSRMRMCSLGCPFTHRRPPPSMGRLPTLTASQQGQQGGRPPEPVASAPPAQSEPVHSWPAWA